MIGFLTVVYKDINDSDEAKRLILDPRAVAVSWTHALRERRELMAAAQVAAARIAELEQELAEMREDLSDARSGWECASAELAALPAAQGEGATYGRKVLLDLISNTAAGTEPHTDNVAVALCSYFEDCLDRPADDEPMEDTGWGPWVVYQQEATVYAIADRILAAAPPAASARIAELEGEVARLREALVHITNVPAGTVLTAFDMCRIADKALV